MVRTRLSIAAFIFLLSLARLASAQTFGSISGTVTAASDGTSLAGAKVVLFTTSGTQATDPGGIGLVGTADSSGAYSIHVFGPGPYYLRAAIANYVSQLYNGIACDHAFDCGTVLGRPGTPVTVAAGATQTVNFMLDHGATISGTVTRAVDGSPISAVTVWFYGTSGQITGMAQTGSNGTYSITGLPFGTYFARSDASSSQVPPDYVDEMFGGPVCSVRGNSGCPVFSGTPIVVGVGTPTATADFSLGPTGSISGTVTDMRTGTGPDPTAVGISVDGVAPAVVLNSSGGYTVNGLLPGTHTVRTVPTGLAPDTFVHKWYRDSCVLCPGSRPTPVAVTSGATTSGIDISIDETAGSIGGTLTLKGYSTAGPVLLPLVQVYNADGDLTRTVAIGAAGGDTFQWSTTGLPPGTYYVRTQSLLGGYWVDKLYGGAVCVAADCDPRRGTPVIVTANTPTSGVNFTLDFGAQISGTVPSAYPLAVNCPGGSLGLCPTTVVETYDSRGVQLFGRGGIAHSNGSGGSVYAIFGLPPGTFYLVARAMPSSADVLYNALPCNACAVTAGTPVTVAAADVKTGINFTTISGQSISGTVRSDGSTNPPSQPIGLVTVQVYTPNGSLVATTSTPLDGTYRFANLAAETFVVRTSNQRGFVDQSTTVTVTSGADVTGIDFALAPGQLIEGQVTGNGAPLNAVQVVLYTSSPSSPAAQVTTDGSGGFTTTLPAGSFFVQTDPIAGYAQQIYNGVACPLGVCPTGTATPVSVGSRPVAAIDFNLYACSAPSIAPVSLAQGAVGIAYRQTLLVTGASGTVAFAVSSGTLPPGLTLDPNTGVLSGTPAMTGHFTFTVSAVDGSACTGSRTYTLDVPACTYADVGPITIPAAGHSDLLGFGDYTCASLPSPTTDVPWITANFGTFDRFTPFGTLHILELGYTVQANTSPAARMGHVIAGPRVITFYQSGAVSSPPFGSVDAPADGVVASGSVAISGWALDALGAPSVLIYRDPVAGESSLIFVGQATFVPGARPDVAAVYPTLPFNTRAGWGYLLLTNVLPNQGNGTFRFWVFAQDADMNQTLLGTKTINVVNASATAPFGAIDTPGQGATASGSAFVNFGWALTPQPHLIPFDGSTIQVLIDGVPMGALAGYNFYRPDVSTLFPGLKNSGGPVGYRVIDTTALSEGLHTIAWLATDDGGITTGIGSRFFTVNNSAWQPSLGASFLAPPAASTAPAVPLAFSPGEIAQADATTAVPPRVDGVDLGRQAASLASIPTDVDGTHMVTMSSLQALQLSLGAVDKSCPATYAGYLVVGGELRPLPIGSSLDPAGTFYWHPGPGFFGTYQLLIVRTSCDGMRTRIHVTVAIH
jgi:hypothetical protein